MKNIEAKYLKPEFNIIDIRDRGEYLRGHIYNAQNIDMKVLLEIPDKYLKKDKTYYIYCTSGYRSKRCSSMLNMLDYDVINVIDGYEGFIKEK